MMVSASAFKYPTSTGLERKLAITPALKMPPRSRMIPATIAMKAAPARSVSGAAPTPTIETRAAATRVEVDESGPTTSWRDEPSSA